MAKKTLVLIIVLLLLAAVLLYLAFASEKKPAQTTTVAPPIISPAPSQISDVKSIPQTVLSLSPNPAIVSSQSGAVDLVIDTGENAVTAVQLELTFDPKVVTITSITPKTFFANPTELLKKIDQKLGKIIYAIAISPADPAKKGTGVVATISFTARLSAGGKTDITFSPKTLVTAEGVRTSVLKTTSGATIIKQ